MVEKIWFENHPIKYLLWPLLWPLSLIVGYISRRRRRFFLQQKEFLQKKELSQKNALPINQQPLAKTELLTTDADFLKTKLYQARVPIIIVGNITAGGNGKTPMVIWLVETLQRLGYTPGVVSRGYGGKAPHYPLLVEERTLAKECGDEPKLIQQRCGVAVAVAPRRSDAVKLLLSLKEQNLSVNKPTASIDIIIADDGLQHYQLDRDLELVIVDGVRRFGNQKLLPLGPLRESVERLNSVDFVITNGGQAQKNEIAMTLVPGMAINLKTKEQKPVDQLKQLVAFAGIGHPPRFFKTLLDLGADLSVTQAFADHQEFELATIERLERQGLNVIMTEKDAVKCAHFAKDNWWYLPVSAQFEAQDEERIINKITKVLEKYGSPSV